MNFLSAIKHAAIGYGIRRKEWADNGGCILRLDHFGDLRWIDAFSKDNLVANLCGPDINADLQSEDIRACDWEVL